MFAVEASSTSEQDLSELEQNIPDAVVDNHVHCLCFLPLVGLDTIMPLTLVTCHLLARFQLSHCVII